MQSAYLVSVSERRRSHDAGEQVRIVMADEGVVLGTDVVGSGPVQPWDQVQPDGQRVHPVVAQHAGGGVCKHRESASYGKSKSMPAISCCTLNVFINGPFRASFS